jgi:menaquinone-dependent protoporphyrinogen oxidase
MASLLVVYGTGEGQTEKIADRVAATIRERGHEVDTVDAAALPPDLAVADYDAAIVGSSIHVGSHQSDVVAFATDNREALADRPTAFFQVSLSSATDDPEAEAQAAGYVDAFVEETGWHPDRIALFGGALRYSKYGFLKRLVMKQIAKKATGDTDTSRDYEYTDWAEVEAFASDVAAFVEGRLGVAPPGE